MQYYKSIFKKTIIALFIVTLTACAGIFIVNQFYLYNPLTVPKPIVENLNFTYDWFSKPVKVEVASYSKSNDYLLYPTDEKKYNEYARIMTNLYAQILDEGTVAQTNYDIGMVGSVDDTVYQMYLQTKKCTLLTLELTEHGVIVRANNGYYTISRNLRDAIISHIRKIYTVKKVR